MEHYIFYSVAGLGISYFLYYFLLKRERSLIFNRFYLLGSLLLCLLAPGLNFEIDTQVPRLPKVDLEQILTSSPESFEEDVASKSVFKAKKEDNVWYTTLEVVYILITLILLFRFTKNLYQILKLTRRKATALEKGLRLIALPERANPFSFFRYLFVNRIDLENKNYSQIVLEHEAAHSRQYHSADVLLMELLSCFFWFNPFIWLYKRAILANHEYLADAAVVASGVDPAQYSHQLIQAGNKDPGLRLLTGFNFIQTKNRLIMLHSIESSVAVRTAKIGITLSLFAAVFFLSSFTEGSPENPLVIVVDAGHGGHDTGNLNEKEINLTIASRLMALADEREIKFIMVREDDSFINLVDRSRFIKAQNADLLLSLHANSSQDPNNNGAEIFYAPANEFAPLSLEFSKIILNHLIEVTQLAEIKEANFKLLRESGIPSILVEVGFLSGSVDGPALNTTLYQQQLAEKLYSGLLEIAKK